MILHRPTCVRTCFRKISQICWFFQHKTCFMIINLYIEWLRESNTLKNYKWRRHCCILNHSAYSTLCKKMCAFLKQPIGLQFPILVKGDLYPKGWTWAKIPTHTYTQLIAEDHWKSSGSSRMKITSLSSDDPSALDCSSWILISV